MPNRDGTGPFGDGRPGRGFGPCGRMGCRPRRGNGSGPGRANGYRFRGGWGQWAGQPAEQNNPSFYPYDKASLTAQKAELEDQLKWVNSQLEDSKDDLD